MAFRNALFAAVLLAALAPAAPAAESTLPPPGKTAYLSFNTRDEPYRSYYEGVTARLLRMARFDFPKANGQSVYGSALLVMTVLPDGKVEKIDLVEASSDAIAEHSAALVRRLQPFEPFPPTLRTQAAKVVLTVPMNYVKDGP